MPLDVYDNLGDPADDLGHETGHPRPYLGILFECCGVYARVYRQTDAAFYRGRCPKCWRIAHVRVGRDGTPTRFFRAS
jgi:hypothetical protein